MDTAPTAVVQPERCPLCGGPNGCRQCGQDPAAGPCWCVRYTFPPELIARVPPALVNRACICRQCVEAFRAETPAPG